MSASELFKAGRLAEAVQAQTQEVKVHPADPNRRLFLFELLAFAGDLDRARRQIEAVSYNQVELDAAVASYRQLLEAEQARRRLFAVGTPPRFFADPPDHARLRLEAVQKLRDRQPADAAALLARADAAAPALAGKLNGHPFSSFRDCDDLFATVLEVMANGSYFWVPLERVQAITMNAPKFPRDLLWVPARLETRDNAAGDVFLPALYPGSHDHTDPQVQLGRVTDWKESDAGPVLGAGQHTFLAGDDTFGLLDWRELVLE